MTSNPKFHFSPETKLEKKPLVEAWLTIHWKLESDPNGQIDPGFYLASRKFKQLIQQEFGDSKPLPANQFPEGIMPHRPREQFGQVEDKGKLLQLGPGVASANIIQNYDWDEFRELALYLRLKLLDAYKDFPFVESLISLQYRNAIPFDPGQADIFIYLKEKFNLSIELPEHIPGDAGEDIGTEINLRVVHPLKHPQGTGVLQVATGQKNEMDEDTGEIISEPNIIIQLEIKSVEQDTSGILDEKNYIEWLTKAHLVAREWFLALIDGELLDAYQEKVD